MEEDSMPTERPPLDAWGLPQSTPSRRDTEDMLARVGRSENESSEAFRRIEDQLRGMSRRLDSSERSHSESNRVLSRTAQEINIASREQAQVFDQLGLNVMALNERLERVERATANDGIREAVKALHMGLSRLADQISQTASQSASQAGNLADNLEQLAGRLGVARVDSENADKQLATRILTVENVAHQTAAQFDERLARLENTAQTGFDRFEQRVAAAEKTVQVHTNAIDHALEKAEAGALARAADQVEGQRRAAFIEENLQGLRDAIMRLENQPARLEQRLGQVEQTLGGVMDQLGQNIAQPLQQSLETLSRRIEGLEKDHNDLLAEVRTGQPHHGPRPVPEFQSDFPSDFPGAAFAESQDAFRPAPAPAPVNAFTAPPFPEAPPPAGHHNTAPAGIGGYSTPAQAAFQPDPFEDGSATQFLYGARSDDHAPAIEVPPMAGAHEPGSDPDIAFAPPPGAEADITPGDIRDDAQDDFLNQARRTARAAAEKAESERHSRGFSWGRLSTGEKTSRDSGEARPRYVIPAAIALIVIVAVAAGLVLSQRARPALNGPSGGSGASASNTAANNTGASNNAPQQGPDFSLPEPPAGNETQFVVAPAATPEQPPPRAGQASHSAAAEPRGQSGATQPLQERNVRPAPVRPVPDNGNQASANRVIQLANANNAIAQTILGLRYLDGTDGVAVNLPQAVKYLTAAANQGQAVAQYRLGTLYERGQGVPADGAKAVHWYQLAANQGNRKAMHNLAVAYASGSAGKKNMAEAARWFAKAAALGLSDSQFNLAVLYERGDGVPQSLLDAYKWYSIAAAAGDSESRARVAVLQSQLSDAARTTAQKSAATFHAAPLNRSANVPPEAADLG